MRGSLRAWIAEHWRTSVMLNLAELNLLLDAAIDAGAGTRKSARDLDSAARRVEAARDRRLRAVQRAQG